MSRKYQKWYNESLYCEGREMKTEELIELALEVGFDHAGELNMGALDFRPEVRIFCLLNNAIISLNYLMNLARPSLSMASTPLDVNVAPVTASTLLGSPAGASFSTPRAMPSTPSL